jgi:hypothetical protein
MYFKFFIYYYCVSYIAIVSNWFLVCSEWHYIKLMYCNMMSLLAFPTSCVGWCARLNSPLHNRVLCVPGARVMLDTEVVKTI